MFEWITLDREAFADYLINKYADGPNGLHNARADAEQYAEENGLDADAVAEILEAVEAYL